MIALSLVLSLSLSLSLSCFFLSYSSILPLRLLLPEVPDGVQDVVQRGDGQGAAAQDLPQDLRRLHRHPVGVQGGFRAVSIARRSVKYSCRRQGTGVVEHECGRAFRGCSTPGNDKRAETRIHVGSASYAHTLSIRIRTTLFTQPVSSFDVLHEMGRVWQVACCCSVWRPCVAAVCGG